MSLDGHQWKLLTEALLDAFPNPSNFQQMLRFRLNKHLAAIAPMGSNLTTIIFEVIQTAEAEGWTTSLIAAARESNPGNTKLLAFAQQQQFALAPSTPPEAELEREIRAANGLLDITEWRAKLGEIETQVCRVELSLNSGKWQSYGTGFLLGPNVLLTNYHVMEPVIEYEERCKKGDTVVWAKPNDVVFRFDYKRLPGGTIVNAGIEYLLADEDWLIDASPMSSIDEMPELQKVGLPKKEQLDYAMLRLRGNPGKSGIGHNPEPGAPQRRWINLPAKPHAFHPNTPLIIVQHPKGGPLKLAIDTDAIIKLNENNTRVTYKTNTENGSSGSPCFDINWNLIAMHHAGDPDFSKLHHPEYNQGIPITAIIELLEIRGHLNKLGDQEM